MYSELLKRCLLGDRIASTQLSLHLALYRHWNRLSRSLQLEPKIHFLPQLPNKPSGFEMGKIWNEGQLLQVLAATRHHDQPLIDRASQLQALQKLREEWQISLEAIDKELEKIS